MSSNLLGINALVNSEKINSSIDLKKKELDCLSNLSFDMTNLDNNETAAYDKDLDELARDIGIDLNDLDNTKQQQQQQPSSSSFQLPPNNEFNDFLREEDVRSHKSYKSVQPLKMNNNNSSDKKKFNDFNKMINTINPNKNTNFVNDFYEEEVKNKKALLIEQISLLKLVLEEENENIDNIPNVNETDDIKTLEHIYKILKIRKDRIHFSTLGEELLLFVTHILENIFDGKTVYFNRFRPNLVGWHSSVQARLRRSRYETSTIISSFVENYQISSTAKIMLDLIPSMFLYSFQKSQHQNKFSSNDLRQNINNVRDV
jgi:hypothetical protein